MDPNTKLTKLLKLLYRNRNKKLTAKEIYQQAGIEETQMSRYYAITSKNISRRKINGVYHYWVRPGNVEYLKRILINTFTNPVTGEMDEQGID